MSKISSRSRKVAELIRDREPFETYGSLFACSGHRGRGPYLRDGDLDRWEADMRKGIRYSVYSYETPIAWVNSDGVAYRVRQKFSLTTSKHQSKLYLL